MKDGFDNLHCRNFDFAHDRVVACQHLPESDENMFPAAGRKPAPYNQAEPCEIARYRHIDTSAF